eukprot:CAMPEP_0175875316 /NCGR_PEP_ID=MMETSP0107_2-20121207/39390_1 /TAXON_ID=195067 ORGANISM="Goniomonas pacifica, Strain CCMP1869" /NCGR_SAMPLE_ID=MMETSP0107_2 /ASSEMBLY_ACC=CAM_ASM_000203 /LENGTH=53 /DNA_ID=CAMNT_0017194327 /DNA_START=74 /DNA_END=232 /DNA_ORIENTATION=+
MGRRWEGKRGRVVAKFCCKTACGCRAPDIHRHAEIQRLDVVPPVGWDVERLAR